GLRIGRSDRHLQHHGLHAEVAERGSGWRQAIVRCVAEIFEIALGRERRETIADRALTPQASLAFESLSKLVGCVATTLGCLVKENLENHVALAAALCVQTLAVVLHHQPFVGIDLAPFAIDLVDAPLRYGCPVAQFINELASRS